LREGYWTPEGYEEVEKKVTTVLKINDTTTEEEAFFFDTELFEQEEKGYYYSSNEDLVNNKPTYYNYIDITNYYPLWNENAFGDLVLHLQNPSFKYVSQKDNSLLAGDYFIIYNSTKYYFSLSNALKKEDELEIIFSYNNSGLQLYLVINQGEHILLTKDETGFKNPTNVKTLFEGIDQYLGDYKIYPNAGFIFSFIRQEGVIKPVLLLNNTEINYDKYTQFAYSFGEDSYETFVSSDIHYNEPFEICYPRIVAYKNNVNYDSNLLTL
jgi:hypothetical protein